MKKTWVRRYWHWITIGLIVITIGMLISAFRDNCFSSFIISFFRDWSVALSAGAAVILAIAAFMSIRENRRVREEERNEELHRLALERMRGWAETVFASVTQPTTCRLIQDRKEELLALLHISGAKTSGILKDAELVGVDMNLAVAQATLLIFRMVARLKGEEEIALFKERFTIEEAIEPITSTEDIETEKKDLLVALVAVVHATAERLVPIL